MTTTRDKLLELAKEAGEVHTDERGRVEVEFDDHGLERFAAMLSQQEQESKPEAWEVPELKRRLKTMHDEYSLLAERLEKEWNEAIEAAAKVCDESCLQPAIAKRIRSLKRPSQAQEPLTDYEKCQHQDCGRFKDRAGWGCRAKRDNACAKSDNVEPAASGAVGERATFEITKSIIHKCPAIKLPQSFLQRLGNTAQIVALKGADDEIAKAIVDALNAALSQQSAQYAFPKLPTADEYLDQRGGAASNDWKNGFAACRNLAIKMREERVEQSAQVTDDEILARAESLFGRSREFSNCFEQPSERSVIALVRALSRAQAAPEGWNISVQECEDESFLRIQRPDGLMAVFTADRGSVKAQVLQDFMIALAAPSTQPQGGGK